MTILSNNCQPWRNEAVLLVLFGIFWAVIWKQRYAEFMGPATRAEGWRDAFCDKIAVAQRISNSAIGTTIDNLQMKPEVFASAIRRGNAVRIRMAIGAAAILVVVLCALSAPTIAASLQQQLASAAILSWALNGVLFLAVLWVLLALKGTANKSHDLLAHLRQAARLIAAAPVDMVIREKSLRLVGLSDGMRRFSDIVIRNGWARPEHIDLGFLSGAEKDQIQVPPEVAVIVREFQAAVATGEPRSYDYSQELPGAAGIRAAIQAQIFPLFGAEDQVIGVFAKGMYFLGHSQSLEDSASARGRAERINDMKTRFLAAVSRDVRNPLNAMAGLLEMASLDAAMPRQSKEMLATVRLSTRSLLQLIPSIVDTRRMETGDLACARVSHSLRRVVADVVALFAPSAYEKGISLTLEVAPGVAASHMADAQGLNQLLNNFLSNAIRFTERGGVRIHLDATPVEDGRQWVSLSVIDTGSGIDPHIQQKLSASRYEAGLSASPDGAGLGLHYCRQIVHRVGGTIRISSVVGEGTHVHVRVPLMLGSGERRDPSQETVLGMAQRPATGLRTLVVESQAANRLLLKSQLEFLGHAVQTAEDGAQGLALARAGRFDLVVCDGMMPDMDGAEFTRALRAGAGECATVPVLGYTADARREDHEAGLQAGMNAALVKPADLRALEAAVASCLPAACVANGRARDGAP
ncbi:response regulator [Achromobacter sp. ACM01]|uniref:hybrid sensor histidine kinase/response regulator n=1 Tax=Achromobacter sp. ACM01 TaxID=2769298 RepID=UPI00177B994A|nr:ATP-binding protein [Achromobacter sp. ACM01]MBD9475375.1 response regulator [Achromobacter sp. ACM01]